LKFLSLTEKAVTPSALQNGRRIVRSSNDVNEVEERPRSVVDAIGCRPPLHLAVTNHQ
jgi:hypothetical protein